MARDGQGEPLKLQESQWDDQFRSCAVTSPDLVVRLGRDGRIVALSPASRKMLGVAPEEVLHRHYLDFIDSDARTQAEQSFLLLLGGVSALELTLQLRHRNNGRIWVEIRAVPWFDGEVVAGVQSVVRDISEQKGRQEILRRTNRILQGPVREQHEALLHNSAVLENLLNTTLAGIGILRHGRFQYLNKQLGRMTGYSGTALLGRHWRTLFVEKPGESSVAGSPPWQSGLRHSVESCWRRADGSLVEVLFSAVPLAARDLSQPHDAALTVVDITARKQTERQLRAAYRELEQFCDAAVPLCLLSLDCRVRKVNQAFGDFFNCAVAEALGKLGGEIWGCEVCATEACPLAQLQSGASSGYLVIDKVFRGRHLACTLRAAPYRDATGQLNGMVVTFFDSRELKTVSAELLATRQQLIQAERLGAIGSLAASIAHEFNNPLCGVRSVLERIARKSELVAADQGLMELALENCDRMSRLIRDLQQFNRPFSDERKDFDLHRAIDSVLVLVNKHLKVRRAIVCRDFGNEPLTLNGSENQIKQVLLNLIKNSGEALPETGGEIRIRTGREGEHIRIVLSDSGDGISEEHLPHLFEPFFTTKTAVKETGLGLSVSYGIIKAHGGDILVESPPGQGTTFTVILPAGNQDKQQGERYAGIHSDRR